MEFWPQARPLALTGLSLRRGTLDYDGEQIAVEYLLELRLSSVHVRNQNTLGPTAPCVDGRARLSMGGDRMDRLAAGFPAATRTRLVHDLALANLSAVRFLHLVVSIRCLRTQDFP